MTRAITIPKDRINAFCRRWRVAELATNRSESGMEGDDLGFFVRFDPSAEWSLTDRMEMQNEFQALSGHSIRIQNRDVVKTSRRPAMRVLYDA